MKLMKSYAQRGYTRWMTGLAGLVAGIVLGVETTPVVWTNMVAGGSSDADVVKRWGNPSNWVDAAGTMLTVAPTNASDNFAVTLTNDLPKSVITKRITTGVWAGGDSKIYLDSTVDSVDPSIYCVTGSVRWEIAHTTKTTYKCQKIRSFTVTDPNGFLGWWSSWDANAQFLLDATSSSGIAPTLHGLTVDARPIVKVQNTDVDAHVGTITGKGAIEKRGNGKLTVDTALDSGSTYYVKEGELALGGHNATTLSNLLMTAAVWFDASKASTQTPVTLEGPEEWSGYNFVSRWDDVRGGDHIYARMLSTATELSQAGNGYHSYGTPCAPYVTAGGAPSGLPVMDFGSRFADNGAYGPSNCWFILSKRIEGVRELFYAGQYKVAASEATLFGGTYNHGTMIDYVPSANIACAWDSQPQGMYLGEIFINGTKLNYNQTSAYLTKFHVASIMSLTGGRVHMLGSDRGFTNRGGGSTLGEVLMFTNVLTRAERIAVNRYLQAKWQTGTPAMNDMGLALVVSDGAKVSVPAGNEASIGRATQLGTTTSKTFVKDGEGRLTLDTLSVSHVWEPTWVMPGFSAPTLDLRAGSVLFTNRYGTIASTAPAANPALWLDAGKADSFTYVTDTENPDITYVSSWKDWRDGYKMYATNYVTAGFPRVPVRQEDKILSGYTVSFGANDTTKSGMKFMTSDNKNYHNENHSYSGFLVVRMRSQNMGRNLFGCSDIQFLRSDGFILSPSYLNPTAGAANWSINGRACDPWNKASTPEIYDLSQAFVIGYRAKTKQNFGGLATDRYWQNNCGGMEVSEVLSYERELTEKEYLETEAYLMKKWLKREHPENVRQILAKVTVPTANNVTLEAVRETQVTALDGGNGTLVKRGSGLLKTRPSTNDTAHVRNIRVEAGTLDFGAAPDVTSEAIFHFDANDADDAFSTYVGKDPDDENADVTFVRYWQDARRNGLVARSMKMMMEESDSYRKDYGAVVAIDPILRTVETAEGITRKIMDFGQCRNVYATSFSSVGSTANPLVAFHDEAAMLLSTRFKNVREVAAVMAAHTNLVYNILTDTYPAGWNSKSGAYIGLSGSIFGDTSYYNFSSSQSDQKLFTYVEGQGGAYSTKVYSKNEADTIITLDGVPCKYNTELPSGFHVMTAATSNEYGAAVGTLMLDRNCNGGGMRVGEAMAFDRRLTTDERTYISAKLMHHWLGTPAPAWTNTLDSLEVVAGATYTSDATTLQTAALSGSGTVGVNVMLSENANLDFIWRTATDYDSMTLKGKLKISDGTCVRVTAVDKYLLTEGDYTLLTAEGGIEAIGGANVLPTLQVVNFGRGFTTKLRIKDGNKLVLTIRPRGTVIIVR